MPAGPPAGESLQEEWNLLLSSRPENREGQARKTGALRKLRKDELPSQPLRMLL